MSMMLAAPSQGPPPAVVVLAAIGTFAACACIGVRGLVLADPQSNNGTHTSGCFFVNSK
jgi:hypothetical protein